MQNPSFMRLTFDTQSVIVIVICCFAVCCLLVVIVFSCLLIDNDVPCRLLNDWQKEREMSSAMFLGCDVKNHTHSLHTHTLTHTIDDNRHCS